MDIQVIGRAQPGRDVWAHDYALDGDENLFDGAVVPVTDEDGATALARVTGHDSKTGYWTFRIEDDR